MTTFRVADGVYGIDTELIDSGFTSVTFFDGDEPTLVDAGAPASAEVILDGLAECGTDPAELSNLVLSHVHTDHSGAASALVDAAPDLDVYIHGLTASHLIDPEALVADTERAMGEFFEHMGEQEPVPATNVHEISDDGATLEIGGSTLELIHAPGHSPDHVAVWNPDRRLLFAAECLGQYYRRIDRWLPPATVPRFDVAAVEDAIERLRALDPERIVFPHFGVWPDDPEEAFELARAELHRFDERIPAIHETTDSRAATRRAVAEELVDLSPAYDPEIEAFMSRLVTDGYLRANDIA